MGNLILHIGAHKTGSSSIQKALLIEKKQLEANGFFVFYPTPPGRRVHTASVSNWFHFHGTDENFHVSVPEALFDLLSQHKDQNVIMSSEEFFWIYEEDKISALALRLNELFSSIQIVAYLRRQDLHLSSHYMQSFKYSHSSARKFYGSKLSALPEFQDFFDRYLDYNTKLLLWERYFGRENLRIRLFEKNFLQGGDVVADFFHILGLDQPQKTYLENTTLSKYEMLLRNACINECPESTEYMDGLVTICQERIPKFNERMYPTEDNLNRLVERYRAGNQQLNERLHISENTALFSIKNKPRSKNSENQLTLQDASKLIESSLYYLHKIPIHRLILIRLKIQLKKLIKHSQRNQYGYQEN